MIHLPKSPLKTALLWAEVEGATTVVVSFGLDVLRLIVELKPNATVNIGEGLAAIVADTSFDLDPIQCFNRIVKLIPRNAINGVEYQTILGLASGEPGPKSENLILSPLMLLFFVVRITSPNRGWSRNNIFLLSNSLSW